MPGMRAELLDLEFDPMTMGSAAERCLGWCSEPRSSHIITTANAAILCMMRRDAELRNACRASDLVVADGMSVVWAMRAAGTALPERVAGVDLMAHLLQRGAEQGLRVYFLGARPEVLLELVRVCKERYPGLAIAGCRDGYFGPEDHEDIIREIVEARPHLLFVGMPSPFKETFCQRYRQQLDVPVIIGVGGSFDVHAGYVRRAPVALQAIGMEWFWRLMMEPRKLWKRYLTTNCAFLWLAGREVLARRFGWLRMSPRLPSEVSSGPG